MSIPPEQDIPDFLKVMERIAVALEKIAENGAKPAHKDLYGGKVEPF